MGPLTNAYNHVRQLGQSALRVRFREILEVKPDAKINFVGFSPFAFGLTRLSIQAAAWSFYRPVSFRFSWQPSSPQTDMGRVAFYVTVLGGVPQSLEQAIPQAMGSPAGFVCSVWARGNAIWDSRYTSDLNLYPVRATSGGNYPFFMVLAHDGQAPKPGFLVVSGILEFEVPGIQDLSGDSDAVYGDPRDGDDNYDYNPRNREEEPQRADPEGNLESNGYVLDFTNDYRRRWMGAVTESRIVRVLKAGDALLDDLMAVDKIKRWIEDNYLVKLSLGDIGLQSLQVRGKNLTGEGDISNVLNWLRRILSGGLIMARAATAGQFSFSSDWSSYTPDWPSNESRMAVGVSHPITVVGAYVMKLLFRVFGLFSGGAAAVALDPAAALLSSRVIRTRIGDVDLNDDGTVTPEEEGNTYDLVLAVNAINEFPGDDGVGNLNDSDILLTKTELSDLALVPPLEMGRVEAELSDLGIDVDQSSPDFVSEVRQLTWDSDYGSRLVSTVINHMQMSTGRRDFAQLMGYLRFGGTIHKPE